MTRWAIRLQQLAIKRQQRALQLLSKQHEFSVVAGAALGMGQLKRCSTIHRNRFGQEELIGLGQILQGDGQIQPPNAQVLQVDMAKALWAESQRLRHHADHGLAGLHMARRLLKEVFAWPDVEPVSGWQQGEFSYPITHRAFGSAVPLVLKGIASEQLDKGDPRFGKDGRKQSAHS
ncbi:MAG: hypothetical protein VKM92_00785 [Cyanobacteriota bacterium]|nr:hypothetical protein [Cyanobacteriota bacterium]